MSSLQVQAFGKLRLQCEGRIVTTFPTHHVEELLGFFLLNQETRLHREKLIHVLWPNSDPDRARGRFSTTLWRLRTLFNKLGAPADTCLQATRDWVSFSPATPLQLDIIRFQEYLAQTKRVKDEALREQILRQALNLYRGQLFEGIYSDWCLVERERLARLRLRAMGQLMAIYIARRSFEAALEWGEAILQEDALREEVHRALMFCYQQLKQYPQAVHQFQTCARLLQDELGVMPLPETVTAYQQIMAERFAASATASQAVQEAFKEFQQAGQRLNQLLDQGT